MRILFLSRWLPYPPDNGSKLRVHALLRGLARQHAVTLISFRAAHEPEPNPDQVRHLCSRLVTVVRQDFRPSSLRALAGFFHPAPRSVLDTYSPAIEQAIRGELDAQPHDLVIASQFDMALYAAAFQGLPAVFEEVELAGLYERARQASGLGRLRAGLTWSKHSRYMHGLLQHFRLATAVSEPEIALLKQLAPGLPVRLLPNAVELSQYSTYHATPRQPNTLIFTGSFSFPPNYAAMLWFIEQVWPQVLEGIPEARLLITGDRVGLPLPEQPGIEHLGYVTDVKAAIAAASLSIAPILSGGGTRLKILEAAALRTPVVATTKGAEGLAFVDGEHIRLADQPDTFARAVIDLLHDPGRAAQISGAAYRVMAEQYDWDALLPGFLADLEGLLHPVPA